MTEMLVDDAFDVLFTFESRPSPLPCDLRPVWRMHLLVLLLEQCRGGVASMAQLHVLNWAVRTEETRLQFLQFLRGKRAPNQIIVRYDPSVNRAVHFAFAEGLVRHDKPESFDEKPTSQSHYRVILADRGRKLAEQIKDKDDCFVPEREFLESIGHKVTQKEVETLFTWSA
jgi:hypothetical protein